MFGVPTPGAGSLGFEGSFIGYGSFDGRDASGLSTGTYGASQFGIGMGWGKKLIGDLAVGLSLHGSQQNLGNGMSFLFGTDAGLLLRTKDGWGAGLSYDGFGLGNTSQDLAASLRVGASKEWTGKSLSLITSLGGSWEPQGGSSLQVGMEGGYGSVLFLRAGYNLQLQTTGFSGFQGFSAGAGIVLDSIHVDYAFVPYGDLGNTHLVSVGYSFGEPPVVAAPKPAVPMTAPAPATVYVQQPSPTPAPSLPPVAPKPVEDKGALQTERTITMEFEVPANDAIVQARNLAKAGQWNPAISVLSDAIKKNPSDAAAWRELGNVYYQVKRKDYAIQCFEKVLRLKPDDKALADWLERYKGH